MNLALALLYGLNIEQVARETQTIRSSNLIRPKLVTPFYYHPPKTYSPTGNRTPVSRACYHMMTSGNHLFHYQQPVSTPQEGVELTTTRPSKMNSQLAVTVWLMEEAVDQ